MGKEKISKKRGISSQRIKSKPFDINTFPGITLKPNITIEEHDPKIALRDKKLIAEALIECLFDGDEEAFKEILSAHLEVMSLDQVSAKSGVPRSTVFRMLGPKSNPTLKNVMKLFQALKVA